jgi:hypothetical protein
LTEALDISEDVIGDFFKFSCAQWRRHRYEVKTLSLLNADEIRDGAFALLNKGSVVLDQFDSKTKNRDYYFICVQDHQVLSALGRDRKLFLLPLLVYVLTHELVHIVRFCNFLQRFEVKGWMREREEKVVHAMTFDILRNLRVPKLGYILDAYGGFRFCEFGLS